VKMVVSEITKEVSVHNKHYACAKCILVCKSFFIQLRTVPVGQKLYNLLKWVYGW